MHSPWQILQLDPASATEKDLKVAYARLIKLHRPDTDPTGFRSVREAYELGMAMLRERVLSQSMPQYPTAGPVIMPSQMMPAQQAPQPQVPPFVQPVPPAVLQPPAMLVPPPVPDELPQAMSMPTVPVQQPYQQPVPPPVAMPVQPPAEPTPPPPAEAPAVPLPLFEAEQAVHAAVAAGDQEAVGRTISHLFYVCRTLGTGSGTVRLWQESLHRVTSGRADLVAMGVPVSQLIAEMEAGSSLITHACVGHWENASDIAALLHLGEAMLADPSRLHADEACIVALRLALETGFAMPDFATRLVNYAYPHLDREARDRYLPHVERQAQAGAHFAGFRNDQRAFWHRRIRRPNAGWNWEAQDAQAAIEYLASTHEPDWPGYSLIKTVAPQDWMLRLEHALIARQQNPYASTSRPDGQAGPAPVPVKKKKRRSRMTTVHWLKVASLLTAAALLVATGLRYYKKFSNRKPVESIVSQARASEVPPAESAGNNWASLAQDPPPPGMLRRPKVDYEAGSKQCAEKAAELRGQPRLSSWVSLLDSVISKLDAKSTAKAPGDKSGESEYSRNVQRFFIQIANSEADPAVEYRVLDLVLLDPRISLDLKNEAINRQFNTVPARLYVPTWKQAAIISPEVMAALSHAARYVLNNPAKAIDLGDSERQELAVLASFSGN